MTFHFWQVISVLLLTAWPTHNLIVALATLRSATPDAPCTTLPFWIIIPALNEELVIANTVKAALALDAPETPVRVLVVDDASTDGTPAALAAINDRRLVVLRRALPEARRGKGEALNAAYRHIRGLGGDPRNIVIGVIDGDGRARPGSLSAVAAAFADRRVDAVQGRVRIHNRGGMLGVLQDIEFCCVADASQRLRDRLGSVGLGGNGQFVRLAALAQFGDQPWSSCLVEDLELGLRLHLAGGLIRYRPEFTITQQGLVDVRRLLRQRTRWAQGNLQCARYLSGLFTSRLVGSVGLLDFLQYLVAPWLMVPISAIVFGVAVLTIAALTTGVVIPVLAADHADVVRAVALWIGVLLLPGLLWALVHRARYRDERLARCLLGGLLYPAFLFLGTVASWRALVRHVRGSKSWVKTDRSAEVVAGPTPGMSETRPADPRPGTPSAMLGPRVIEQLRPSVLTRRAGATSGAKALGELHVAPNSVESETVKISVGSTAALESPGSQVARPRAPQARSATP